MVKKQYIMEKLIGKLGGFVEDVKVRKFKKDDEKQIVSLIRRARRKANIRDYSKELIEELCNEINEDIIIERGIKYHTYVVLCGNKIIGVGSVSKHLDKEDEVQFHNIYVLPECQGKGIGKIIIKCLENDEYCKNTKKIHIFSSITAMEFYKHMGYSFTKNGYIVDSDGEYKLEKNFDGDNNHNAIQYDMRPYIDSEYHRYKDFILSVYEKCNLKTFNINNLILNDKNVWIIRLEGIDIGFYSGENLNSDNYRINAIFILPEFQNRGIGSHIINDIIRLHKKQNIQIEIPKNLKIENYLLKFGFVVVEKTEKTYKLFRDKNK